MPAYATTEEARELVSVYHPEGAEIPQEVRFETTSNHLESAVIWAAMGEPGQTHNIGQLYEHFSVKSPGYTARRDHGSNKTAIREEARKYFSLALVGAQNRLEERPEESLLEALQFQLANQWDFSRLVSTFAVDSLGVAVKVDTTGGIISQGDSNYTHILRGVQQRIDLEFHRS